VASTLRCSCNHEPSLPERHCCCKARRSPSTPHGAAQDGGPETRPAEIFSVIHATPEMLHEKALLATNAAVAA
jgi:hypothetical protein